MMQELGQELRKRREELGLDLDELEARTKIRKRYLIALEQGDWSALPGEVYARGFVRSYAESVGLDGRALLQKYLDGERGEEVSRSRESDPVRTGSSQSNVEVKHSQAPISLVSTGGSRSSVSRSEGSGRHQRSAGRKARGISGQAFAVLGILVVLCGGLWAVNRYNRSSGNPVLPNTQGAGVTGSTRPTAENNATNDATGQPSANESGNLPAGNAGQTNASGDNSAAGNNALQNPAGGTASPGSVQIGTPTFRSGTLTYPVAGSGPLSVTLSAPRARLWTMVTADGKNVDGLGGETLAVGQAKTYQANQTITFRIGNVPAASFTVNGQAVTLPAINQAINITFVLTQSPAGSQQNVAK